MICIDSERKFQKHTFLSHVYMHVYDFPFHTMTEYFNAAVDIYSSVSMVTERIVVQMENVSIDRVLGV